MRYILFSTILALSVLSGLHQSAFAVCIEGPPNTFTCNTADPNPDPVGIQELGNDANLNINVLPGAGIDTTILPGDDDGIQTGNGINDISVNGGSVVGENRGIRGGDSIERVTLRNATIHSVDDDTISLLDGNDVLEIVDSIITSVKDTVVRMANDDDTAQITGSELKVLTASGNDTGFGVGDGNDIVFVENSLIQGGTTLNPVPNAIALGRDNDLLTLGNGVVLKGLVAGNEESIGLIDCNDGFDTIVFAMDVPPEQLNRLSGEIALADPSGDSITINGLFYQWQDCELLVNELVGVRAVRPIPTLSQWSLIVTAGILGVIGFIALRRRAAWL